MKNETKIFRLTLAFMFIFYAGSILADADAKRKNKCNGSNKRYKQTAKVKGGNNNCGNTGPIGPGWHCIDSFTQTVAFSNKGNSDVCKCGGIVTAASATAHANLTTRVEHVVITEFSCKSSSKWKGGRSTNYQFVKTPVPMLYSVQGNNETYLAESRLVSGTDTWDYLNNSVTINDLSGYLIKYTDDMVNDFSTFIIEVSKTIGETSSGEEINTILYSCRATIYGDELVIEDASNTIKASDFVSEDFGLYGKKYTLNVSSLTIPLGIDINSEDDLTVAFYGDCGNYEQGSGGRFAINSTSVIKINEKIAANSHVKLDILNNPVIDEELQFSFSVNGIGGDSDSKLQFAIRDNSGKILQKWTETLTNTTQTRSSSVSALPSGIFLLTLQVGNREFARRFVVER